MRPTLLPFAPSTPAPRLETLPFKLDRLDMRIVVSGDPQLPGELAAIPAVSSDGIACWVHLLPGSGPRVATEV